MTSFVMLNLCHLHYNESHQSTQSSFQSSPRSAASRKRQKNMMVVSGGRVCWTCSAHFPFNSTSTTARPWLISSVHIRPVLLAFPVSLHSISAGATTMDARLRRVNKEIAGMCANIQTYIKKPHADSRLLVQTARTINSHGSR